MRELPLWKALLGARPRFMQSAPARPAARVERVRQAMRALAQSVAGVSTVRLQGAIERADDLRTLWFLRSALMQAVAAGHGEAVARAELARLDALFRRSWPDAPVSRPAPLA